MRAQQTGSCLGLAMVAGLCKILTLVQVIALQGNHLRALPSLPASLHTVCISRNLFQKFPESLCSLPSLTDLDLGRNQLQSVPPAISQLQNLKFLNLMNNQLECLPSEMGSLPSLYRLGLKSNKLTELPEAIGNLHSLVGGSMALWQGVFIMWGALKPATLWSLCTLLPVLLRQQVRMSCMSGSTLTGHILACSLRSVLCRWSCSSQTIC